MSRRLDDGTRMTGNVTIDDNGDYREKGLRNGEPFWRHYRYVWDGHRLRIHYADGARSGDLLHDLAFMPYKNGFEARHTHSCGEDRYAVLMRVRTNSFFVHYTVSGPAKNYRMATRYGRL